MRSLVIAVVLAWCSLAHAEQDPFADYVASIERGKPDAAWLAHCQVLVTPSGAVRRPCTLILYDLVGAQQGVTLKVRKNKEQAFPQSTLRFREAIVEARAGTKLVATFHVLAIGAHPTAVHWSQLVADRDAAAAAKAGTLKTPPAIKDFTATSAQTGQGKLDDEALYDDLARIKDSARYQQDLAAVTSDGVIVFGTGPGERYTGKSGQKTISRWKMDLDQRGGVDVSGGNLVGVAITQFTATTHAPVAKAKKPTKPPPSVTIAYVAFVVYTQFMTGGGSVASRPALVKFAIAR